MGAGAGAGVVEAGGGAGAGAGGSGAAATGARGGAGGGVFSTTHPMTNTTAQRPAGNGRVFMGVRIPRLARVGDRGRSPTSTFRSFTAPGRSRRSWEAPSRCTR